MNTALNSFSQVLTNTICRRWPWLNPTR